MGSNGRGKDGEGTSGVNKVEENYEQELKSQPAELLLYSDMNINGFGDPMVQLAPPLIIQQVPVASMQRPRVAAQPQPRGYVEYVLHERLKRVKISWNHSGTNVAIAGSWDNWETTEALQRVGQNFVIVKTLPIGIFHYRFIVDGYLTHAPEFPWASDDSGYAYNILDLQDYIPETLARLFDFEHPSSPPSSYDNRFLNEDEFSKPPPELPPQLPVTIRDEPSTTSGSHQSVPRLTHLELNHLYIHKTDRDPFVALRSTHKFQHKYVTMVMYKSLRGER